MPRASSFRHAWAGIRETFRTEGNFRFHLAALVGVAAFGAWLGIGRGEWCAVVLASALVLSMEAANTALERLGDALTRERHPGVGAAKDAAAGAVLIAAIAAVAVGLLVFVQAILRRIR